MPKISRQMLAILKEFADRSVIHGVGQDAIVDQIGMLKLESERSVVLTNARTGYIRTIRLADIRWVEDPNTRLLVGVPW